MYRFSEKGAGGMGEIYVEGFRLTSDGEISLNEMGADDLAGRCGLS